MTSLVVRVKRGHRGYGLSLVYRGLDKYAERDTGVFVSRVLPGGQSEKYGLRYSNQRALFSRVLAQGFKLSDHNI